jgi:ABC-type amino acid transport substrate-binding protein
MKIRLAILLLFSMMTFQGCAKADPEIYRVGIDPSFFPLQLIDQADNVYAFSCELLREVAKISKTELQEVQMSWDNLNESLQLGKTEAIFSAAPPNLINNTKYSFSECYLKTGPVLIAPKGPKEVSLKNLSTRIVAMGKTADELDLMQIFPEVEFVFYDSLIDALEGTAEGKYAACLIPTIPAHAYIKDLFQNQLMISSDVLTPQGLRMLTLKGQNQKLLESFNKALQTIQENGTYDKLLAKWSLSN